MVCVSELAGSVRPYFGRSMTHATREKRTARAAAAAEVVSESSGPRQVPSAVMDVDLQHTLRLAADATGWKYSQDDGTLVVPVGSTRSQLVKIQLNQRDETGQPIVVYSSTCGAATAVNATALLRRNSRLHLLSFAIEKVGQDALIVLRGIQRCEAASADGIREMATIVARYADSVERKLSTRDAF